jgi:hypothetical protein
VNKDRVRQQYEDGVVLDILRTAFENPLRVGSREIDYMTVDDVLLVAEAGIGRAGVLSALKRLHDECMVARCLCCDMHLHWRYVHPQELATLSGGKA